MIPRKRVTVCAGTSWLKATRNAICTGMVPAMTVKVQLSLRESVKKSTITQSVRKFGTSDTMATNFANSADDQALSR